jgi:hypothetical protein
VSRAAICPRRRRRRPDDVAERQHHHGRRRLQPPGRKAGHDPGHHAGHAEWQDPLCGVVVRRVPRHGGPPVRDSLERIEARRERTSVSRSTWTRSASRTRRASTRTIGPAGATPPGAPASIPTTGQHTPAPPNLADRSARKIHMIENKNTPGPTPVPPVTTRRRKAWTASPPAPTAASMPRLRPLTRPSIASHPAPIAPSTVPTRPPTRPPMRWRRPATRQARRLRSSTRRGQLHAGASDVHHRRRGGRGLPAEPLAGHTLGQALVCSCLSKTTTPRWRRATHQRRHRILANTPPASPARCAGWCTITSNWPRWRAAWSFAASSGWR